MSITRNVTGKIRRLRYIKTALCPFIKVRLKVMPLTKVRPTIEEQIHAATYGGLVTARRQ